MTFIRDKAIAGTIGGRKHLRPVLEAVLRARDNGTTITVADMANRIGKPRSTVDGHLEALASMGVMGRRYYGPGGKFWHGREVSLPLDAVLRACMNNDSFTDDDELFLIGCTSDLKADNGCPYPVNGRASAYAISRWQSDHSSPPMPNWIEIAATVGKALAQGDNLLLAVAKKRDVENIGDGRKIVRLADTYRPLRIADYPELTTLWSNRGLHFYLTNLSNLLFTGDVTGDMKNSTLFNSRFGGSRLDVQFSNCDISFSEFTNSNVRGGFFSCDLIHSEFKDCAFYAQCTYSVMVNARFVDTFIDGAKFQLCTMKDAAFYDCTITDISVVNTDFTNVRFDRSSIDAASWKILEEAGADLSNCIRIEGDK